MACSLVHPFDAAGGVEDEAQVAFFKLVTEGVQARDRATDASFEHYMRTASELAAREAKLHASLHPTRRDLVEGKRFLLM